MNELLLERVPREADESWMTSSRLHSAADAARLAHGLLPESALRAIHAGEIRTADDGRVLAAFLPTAWKPARQRQGLQSGQGGF